VADERDDGLNKKAPAMIYMPALVKNFEGNATMVQRSMSFVVRSRRAGSEAFVNELRQAVWAINPNVPLSDVGTLGLLYNKSLARTSLTLTMLAIAGCMALLLGVIGIYGVISYSVSQRTREIGIRMAIGASPLELTQMFVRHGLMLAGIGVACGLTAAILLSRLLEKLLFEVSPVDPLTYGLVAIGLAAAATLASYLPARRASTIDPIEALRLEY
jgi:ABC-type antimicrobial peptide transport system permease subunit